MSTQSSYSSSWKTWTEFCSLAEIAPVPVLEENLVDWASWAALTRKYDTVSNYVPGIRHHALLLGHIVPKLEDMPLLLLMLRGIKNKRAETDVKRQRWPINNVVLERLISCYTVTDTVTEEIELNNLLMIAVMCAAHWMLMRVSEYTVRSVKSTNFVRVDDLKWHTDANKNPYYTMTVATTKTSRAPVTFSAPSTGGATCPVTAMRNYMDRRYDLVESSLASPLFMLHNGTPMTSKMMCDAVNTVAGLCGMDPSKYKSHSFRLGGATTLATAGASAHVIQAIGRWTSYAYQLYISTSVGEMHEASFAAAAHVSASSGFDVDKATGMMLIPALARQRLGGGH